MKIFADASISYALDQDILDQLPPQELPDNIRQNLEVLIRDESIFAQGTKFEAKDKFIRLLEQCGADKYQELLLARAKLALTCPFECKPDFTLYFPRAAPDDAVQQVLQACQPKKTTSQELSYEGKLWLWNKTEKHSGVGRVLVCSAFEGKYWSLTFREDKYHHQKTPAKKETHLNDLDDIGELLAELIFPATGEAHGMVVIVGRTGSAKSQILDRLLKNYLKRQAAGRKPEDRNLHVLTYEDPIEKYLYPTPTEAQAQQQDYTPRQKGLDVVSLRQATQDALRQTPSALLVGETRNLAEWKDLVHFAGTGHLVLTTAHAGSLTEAMGTILQATRATDHSGRSIVADRLLALIHLHAEEFSPTEAEEFSGTEKEKLRVLYPTIWRHTPEGAKALMAEGLSSILPNTPEARKDMPSPPKALTSLPSSIGRYWFARELVAIGCDIQAQIERKAKKLEEKNVADSLKAAALAQDEASLKKKAELIKKLEVSIKEKAITLDLEGM